MTDEEELAVLNAGLRGDDADQKELAALNARLTQTPQSDEDELAALNAGLRGTNDASKGEKKELRTGSPTWAGIKGFFSGLAEGAWAGGNAAANKIVKAIPEVGIGLESAAGHGVRFVGKGLRAIGAEGIGKAVESAGEGIVGSAAGTKAWLDEKLPSNAKDWLGYEDWSTKASDWVGNAASMAVKFAPGSAAVGGKAFMEAIFESDGVNAFAQVHDTAKANGASEAEAMALGGEAALINYFGGKALMRAGGWADGVKSAGGKFLASGAASSATMAAQGAGNRMVENMAERKPLMEGVAAEAGKGLVEGAMFHVYNAIPGYARGVVANRAERRKHEEYIRDLVLEHAKTEEGAAQLAVYLDSPALDAAIQARKAGREITGKMASEIGLPDVMTTAEVEGVIDAVSGQRRARAERVRLGMDEVQAQALAETVGSYVGEDAKLFEAVWLKAAENISDARELDDPARREEIVQKAAEEIGGETAEADRIVLDYDRATGGSNVINGDTIRSQMKGFVASDPETHKKLQPRSNEIRERIFAAKLAARKGKGGEAPGHVLFTMGGPGSGKSSTTEAMSKTVDFTYDSTGANYKDLSDKVRRVIANGQTPVVEFVYCDPATAWERAKGRVEDGGHAASAGEFADMHIDARNNLERLISEFGNGIIVRIYDNTGKSPVEISLEELYGRPRYDKAAIAEITGRLDNAAREAGSGSRGGARGGEGPQVASSKPLELFRQLDEGKLPVEEVAIGDVEAIAPTENGNFIEEYDAAKAKPIVVWEDLEGNRHAVTGGKRLLSADASGAETIKAVVVREADGWSEADARGLGATENLREGRGTIKNVVDAVGTLGADKVAELAGWHQANGSRDFASTLRKGLAVAQKGAPELKAALAEGRIGEDFAYNAAQVLSMERVGEGWETAQRELAELIGKVGPEELEAVLWGLKGQLSAKADRSDIDWGAAIAEERAKYNAKRGGADGKLDSDAVLMETEDNELKTLGEVEAENGKSGPAENLENKGENATVDETADVGGKVGRPKMVSIAKEGIEYREAKVRLDEQKGKDFSNSRTGISARLSSTGARKLISDAAVAKSVANGFTRRQHNEIAANVGALFEDASLVESRPDKAGDINVKSIKRFITPIEVDGKEAVAWITVKESTEHGHRIYSVEGIKIAALSPSMRRALADRNSADNAASVEESQSVLDGLNPRKYTATLPTAGSIPNNTLRVNEGEAPNFAAAQGAAENKAVELRPAGDKPGVFTTLSHPEARFTVDGETRTVAIDGLTEADFEPGRIGQTAALVAKVEAYAANHLMKIGFRDDGVQRLWETVRENIKAEGKEAYSAAQVEAKRKVVLEQLKKSGLAEEVVESAEDFERLFQELSGEALRAGEEVYGFCDPKTKKIYLNPEFFATQQGLEVPIHEFGHLGVIACEKVNKAVYDQGMKLAKELLEGRGLRGAEPANQDGKPANQDRGLQGLVDFILNDRVYLGQSREVQAQELLAQLIGKRGEEALRAESNKSVAAKVKAWLVEFWNTFGKALGLKDITPEEAAKMTVEDVADAIRAEMLSGRKYGEGFAGVEFSEGGAKVKTKPTRIRRKLTGRRKAVNDFVAKMGGGEDPANTETDLLALWVDNGGQLFDKIPYEVETGYSKGKSGMKLRKSSVADEFAESTAFYKGLTPAQRKVYFGTGKLEHGSIGGTLAEKLADAGITRFTNEDGTVDYEAVIGEFERQWTNYERGEQYLKERGEREEEHDRAIVEEMERAEQAEYEAVFGKDAPDALTPEEAAAQDAQIAADMEAGLFSRKGGPLFARKKMTALAKAKVGDSVEGVTADSLRNAIEKRIEDGLKEKEYSFKKPGDRKRLVNEAVRFYKRFSQKTIMLSDGRCVYFVPDARAKTERGLSNDEAWAEYAVHAVTSSGQKLEGKNYNERLFNKTKAANIWRIENILKAERCELQEPTEGRDAGIAFYGRGVDGKTIKIITRLDEANNIYADLSEVTVVNDRKKKELPPRKPPAEVVGAVRKGGDLLTDDTKSIPNSGAGAQGGVRWSRSGIYTGTAADYANRSRQGGVDDGPSLKKIGTGEGSQVYGWGLYGSTVRGVAEGYARGGVGSGRIRINGEKVDAGSNTAEERVARRFGWQTIKGRVPTREQVLEDTKTELSDRRKQLAEGGSDNVRQWVHELEEDVALLENRNKTIEWVSPGNLYEQTFFTDRAPGDESHLLKWYEDLPKEQVDWIAQEFAKEGFFVASFSKLKGWTVLDRASGKKLSVWDKRESGETYEAIASFLGSPKAASEFLARAGIDGVKYPVDSYGGKGVKDGDEAGWNYVSFRDDNIRVDHKWTDGQLMFSRAPSRDGKEYTYAALTARPDMPLVQVDAKRAKQYGDHVSWKLADARKSILAAGGRLDKGHYIIDMEGEPVEVGKKGLLHGKHNRNNDFIYPVLGEVLKNTVRVNELDVRAEFREEGKKDDQVNSKFIYLGAAAHGDVILPVRIQIDRKAGRFEIGEIDVLKSINAKMARAESPAKADLTGHRPPNSLATVSISNLIGIAQPLHPQIFSKDVAAALNKPYQGGEMGALFSRGGKPPEAEHVKLTRVADDAGQGEQTPGAMAASRELSRQGAVPINTKGTRYVSLPLSEMNALTRYLTGHAMPAEMESGRKLGAAGKASLKHRKLTIAADVLGVVDKTDMAAEKAMLKQRGFFAHEDSNWCATHSPAEVRKERERSEEALSSQLEKIADKRIAGREPGGMAAGRKVFADQLAQVVMAMPHGQPGALGAMQTVAGALEKRVRGSETEAETFLDWMEGVSPGGAGASGRPARSGQERKAGMFAAFLIMPKEMEARAKGWYDAIRSTIAGDQKLADAFRKMTARMMSEQGHAHLEAEILRAQDAQTEAAIKKLQAEANEPIKAGGKLDQAKETVVLSCDDRMGAAVVRVDAAAKVYLAAQKLLMKQAKTPAEKAQIKQQTDLFMGQLAQAKNQAELSRTAWERGRNNADARYLWRMVDLLNEATVRDGLRVRDLSLYLDQMRVIETRGLSGSRGESARQAQLIIDAMRKRLGADFAKVESFARRFHAIHEQELLNNPLLEKILGKGTADYWRSQTSYVTTKRTFSPEELAEIEAARRVLAASGAAGGDTVVGQMFKYCGRPEATAKLKGSFADKQEVMSATFEKVAEVQRFLRRSEYVIRLRDMLKLANVEGVHDMPAGKNEFKSNKRYGAISYMENGQKRTLVVPREIADGFERQSMYNSRALKICASVNNIARQLWIDWNPVYWHRNLSRNAGSIEMNMPGMRESIIKRGARFVFPGLAPVTEMAMTHLVRHMPERMSLGLRKIWGEHTALYYAPKAKRMAMWLTDHSEMQRRLWDAEKRGDLGAVQEMEEDRRDMLAALKANMLVGISAGKASGTAGFLDDSVKTVGKTMQREMQDWKAKSKFRKVLDTVNIFSKNAEQQVFEDIMAKFSAYLHDRAQFGTGNNRTAEESGLLVKKNVSIGEGERKGETAGITQAIFQPFWNMVEKGVVRNVKAYKERPAETFGKAAWRIAPMLLQGLIGSGAVAAWILKSNDGDEEKVKNGPMGDVYRYLRGAQRAYQNCSNYVRNNYHVTPLWTDGYTSIVIGMPLTDEERLLKPIARFVADAASVASGTKESLDVAGFLSDATGVIAPDFKIAGALPTLLDDTVHAFWENPEDYYTGGQKYDNDTWALRNESWEMRGKFTAAMAKRLWNDFGGRNVLPVDRAGVDNGLGRAPGWVAKMVNDIPVVSPILRSFVKVQVGSPKRDAAEITEAEARRRAVCRVCAKELFETAHKAKGDISIDQAKYNVQLQKWKERYDLTDDELADIEGRYLNAWRSYEGAQYRADGEREKYRVKAERLGMDAANIWLDFD